jgi:F420-non-reducing hydrogenase iron-sulfur subunit
MSHPFEPKLVAFCCTYCAYAAGDLAGSMRLDYAPNVRVVKILCTGKIDAVLLLRAFEDGADGVYVAGCARGDCHFLEGNLRAIQVVAYAKKLLAEIEPERLEFFHIPASAGPLFAARANEMTDRVRKLGPNRLRAAAGQDAGGKLANPVDEHPPLPPARFGRLITDAERVAGAAGDSTAGGQTFLSVLEKQTPAAAPGGPE